jgi:hypothetical protein
MENELKICKNCDDCLYSYCVTREYGGGFCWDGELITKMYCNKKYGKKTVITNSSVDDCTQFKEKTILSWLRYWLPEIMQLTFLIILTIVVSIMGVHSCS